MFTIAQTNLQLYALLNRQGRTEAELRQIGAAYQLAMQLFSARFRASGKPFVAHLVGTASVLASLEQSTTVVAAGLLHAAFDQGDFGDGASGITAARQKRLRQAVGAETTALIENYQRLSRRQAMAQLHSSAAAEMPAAEREVLLMHLADTLDEHVDGGLRYAPGKSKFFDRAGVTNVAAETIAAVDRLGFGAFSPAFAEVFATADPCNPPAEMLSSHTSSFTVIPASYCQRPTTWFRRIWQKLWRGKLSARASAAQAKWPQLATRAAT